MARRSSPDACGVHVIDVIIPLDQSEDRRIWKRAAAQSLEVPAESISDLRLLKHSIDARKRRITVRLRLEVATHGGRLDTPSFDRHLVTVPPGAPEVLIVGCGPAGLFAALRCLERGMKPIVLERGKDASSRRFDLAPLLRRGHVIEDSNYCFGEGGAGTFSDGKLYTRATKRGPVREIYETLVAHGAPSRILIDAHPHIGSNRLPNVVKALRDTILKSGGEVRFGAKVVDFVIDRSRVAGVVLAGGETVGGEAVILATGHSARDIYALLERRDIRLEPKPFAVGVRIEHPQSLVDQVQYHLKPHQGRPDLLPAARYRLATKIDGRGVHSFCMCPGGFIVPAATANDEVVVNGMSLSRRDSPFANSGMVVTVEPEDLEALTGEAGVLAGMTLQKGLERAAKQAGGGGQVAPAQLVSDFLGARDSAGLPETSYFPGVRPARLDEILPRTIVVRLQRGLELFGRQMRGYLDEPALMVGFETRTSSPVRIPRDPETRQHPQVAGLFPCGEGAGYAGGIVSAALDGLQSAEAVAAEVRARVSP